MQQLLVHTLKGNRDAAVDIILIFEPKSVALVR